MGSKSNYRNTDKAKLAKAKSEAEIDFRVAGIETALTVVLSRIEDRRKVCNVDIWGVKSIRGIPEVVALAEQFRAQFTLPKLPAAPTTNLIDDARPWLLAMRKWCRRIQLDYLGELSDSAKAAAEYLLEHPEGKKGEQVAMAIGVSFDHVRGDIWKALERRGFRHERPFYFPPQ
jgi:hypothetical protein